MSNKMNSLKTISVAEDLKVQDHVPQLWGKRGESNRRTTANQEDSINQAEGLTVNKRLDTPHQHVILFLGLITN